jgi:hypothetical protein
MDVLNRARGTTLDLTLPFPLGPWEITAATNVGETPILRASSGSRGGFARKDGARRRGSKHQGPMERAAGQ